MNFFSKLALLTLLTLVTSCNFTENITINEDGTGDFAIEIDASGLMAMAGDKISEKMGQTKNTKILDSTFSFKEIYEAKKDSIATLPLEEQEALEKMKDFVMNMKMNTEKKEFLLSINSPFKNVSDLQNMMGGMKKLNDLKGKTAGKKTANPLGDGLNNKAKIDFTYTGTSFTRTAIIDKEALKKVKKDSTGMANMMFASSKYTLKYHFPKPVKTVSNPDAMYSADRKTVTIQYPFTDYMDNPKKMNLTIDFE